MSGTSADIRLLLLDMDGTLTPVRSPWQYVHEVFGLWDGLGQDLLNAWLAGRISYLEFCDRDAAAWSEAGHSLEEVLGVLSTIPVPQETLDFLRQVTARGIRIAIISTGFVYTAKTILAQSGIDPDTVGLACNSLLLEEGVIQPRLDVIAGDDLRGKAAWSRRFMNRFQATPETAGAIGDSSADVPMFESVKHCFRVTGPEQLCQVGWLSQEVD